MTCIRKNVCEVFNLVKDGSHFWLGGMTAEANYTVRRDDLNFSGILQDTQQAVESQGGRSWHGDAGSGGSETGHAG
jgi:hypothetical protein